MCHSGMIRKDVNVLNALAIMEFLYYLGIIIFLEIILEWSSVISSTGLVVIFVLLLGQPPSKATKG